MNKKIVIAIIAIAISIGIVAVSYTFVTTTNTVSANQTSNTVKTPIAGKHYDIQLNESMDIKSKS